MNFSFMYIYYYLCWCVPSPLLFLAACEAAGSENSDDSASGGAEVGATGHSDEDDKTGHE